MLSASPLLLGTCLLAAAATGCTRRPGAPVSLATPVASLVTAPRLLFFGGRLTAATGPARLEVLQLQVVPGELKQAPTDASGPYLLRLTQLDAAGRPLASVLLPHPLRPNVEHIGADQRTFQRSQAQVPTAEFSARLAVQPSAATLRVEEILGSYTAVLALVSLSSAKP